METLTQQLEALTDMARQETARALLAELTGQTRSRRTGFGPDPVQILRSGQPGDAALPPVPGMEPSRPEEMTQTSHTSPAEETRTASVTRRTDGGVTLRRSIPGETVPGGVAPSFPATGRADAGETFEGMQAVSDFFRRDSRRYDPGYARY